MNDTRQLHIVATLFVGTVLLSPATGRAAVLNVPGDFTTVADAVTAATIGDTIAIGAGTFPTSVIFTKSLTLAGAGRFSTFLDGADAGRVLTTTPGVTLTVRDLVVRRGAAPAAYGFGGAVLNDGDLRMERCVLWDSSAPVSGGALSNINGNAHLVDCTLLFNHAGFGGGAIDNNATLTLENCTITGGGAATGGAIINTGDMTLINCTLSENTAQSGGALHLHDGTADIRYSTVSGNDATDADGGGILALNPFTAQGAIIAGNLAQRGGPDVLGKLGSNGYNLIGSDDGADIVPLTGAGPDQVGSAGHELGARLGLLTDNGGVVQTMMPASNSPAVDKGGASNLPAWDARGAHRPRDGGSGQLLADVGAVELGPIGYTATDLHRALQITAGLAAAGANDAWLNVDGSPGVDLSDCAHLARRATGLE